MFEIFQQCDNGLWSSVGRKHTSLRSAKIAATIYAKKYKKVNMSIYDEDNKKSYSKNFFTFSKTTWILD